MAPDEVVNRFIAALEALDVDAAMAFVSDDISYENVPIQPIAGRDAVAQTLHGFLAPATAVEWRVLEQWTVVRTVINERIDRFQIGDGWLELPVAGFFRVDDHDRIALWRDYFDMGSYVQQLTALTA
jgi:limonene-1,2-epoxide hydrolase